MGISALAVLHPGPRLRGNRTSHGIYSYYRLKDRLDKFLKSYFLGYQSMSVHRVHRNHVIGIFLRIRIFFYDVGEMYGMYLPRDIDIESDAYVFFLGMTAENLG